VPTDKVKLLGVTLDKELRFKVHLADKAGKATRVALALRRMKGLQPKAVKQLAQSAVLPVADYASPVWYPIATHDMKQLLLQPQRITAQAVCSSPFPLRLNDGDPKFRIVLHHPSCHRSRRL
jgi:hypothetical protein